jgi:hypothetical protein
LRAAGVPWSRAIPRPEHAIDRCSRERDARIVKHVISALAVERDRIYAGSQGDGAFAMPVGPVITTTSTSTTASSTTSTTLQPVILGKTIEIKDTKPGDPSRRHVVVFASSDGLDPATVAANGATVVVNAAGETPSSQLFSLPAPWTLLGTTGVR